MQFALRQKFFSRALDVRSRPTRGERRAENTYEGTYQSEPVGRAFGESAEFDEATGDADGVAHAA